MQKRRLIQDAIIFAASICIAFFLVYSGWAEQLILFLGNLSWAGIIFVGAFFTSAFTTAPSIAMISQFAHSTSIPVLVVLGAMGAAAGDFIIFKYIRDRVAKDFEYILSHSKNKRIRAIFHTRLLRFVTPFLGGVIIASPLPDELGIAMMGLSRLKSRTFLLISFIFNGIGILIISLLSKI